MRLTSSLTIRYAFALILIAMILIATHLLSTKRIESTAVDGHLIDTSGMQRMLSQRIGLLSFGVLSTWGNADPELADNLSAAIKTMAVNHLALKADWQERAVSGDEDFAALMSVGGLSDRVDKFIKDANDLHQRYTRTAIADGTHETLATPLIIMAERSDFLDSLDDVVKIYTRQNAQTSTHLNTIQTYSLAFGLVILVFEVLFIFQPMVKRIGACVDVLNDANEELHSMAMSLSHDLKSPIVDSLKLMQMVNTSLSNGKVVEAAKVSGTVYASMITMQGVIAELLEVVGAHRKAISNFSRFGASGLSLRTPSPADVPQRPS